MSNSLQVCCYNLIRIFSLDLFVILRGLYLKKKTYFIFLLVCVPCVCVYACVCGYPLSPEEDIGSSGTGATVMSHPMWVPLLEQYVLLWPQSISLASEDLETYTYLFIYISLAFIYPLLPYAVSSQGQESFYIFTSSFSCRDTCSFKLKMLVEWMYFGPNE